MLSICIPIYNFNVSELVEELNSQANKLNIPYEIILIDDCSKKNYQKTNSTLNKINSVKYIQLKQNIGRSKIRNLFLNYVLHDNLLFLDCDLQIISKNFIKNYVDEINNGRKVICGGINYDKKKPQRNKLLRWNFGIKRECISANKRKENPYSSFMTANFVVDKSIFKQIKFNEELANYGHEDTLFGYELKQNKIKILHIENPINHQLTDVNKEFLYKTKQGIKNLVFIKKRINNLAFDNDIRILKFYNKINKSVFKLPLNILLNLIYPIVYFILLKFGRSLFLFDIYKITLIMRFYK